MIEIKRQDGSTVTLPPVVLKGAGGKKATGKGDKQVEEKVGEEA